MFMLGGINQLMGGPVSASGWACVFVYKCVLICGLCVELNVLACGYVCVGW